MYNNKIVINDIEDIISRNKEYSILHNKRILITGSSGMLASYLLLTFTKLNDLYDLSMKIFLLVRNSNKLDKILCYQNRKDIIIIQQDVCTPLTLEDRIDLIFHFASSSNPKTILNNPVDIIKANTIGTYNILEFARKNKSKIYFSSTREVYGDVNKDFISEDDFGLLDQTNIRSCYPESKKLAENLIITYNYQYNIDYIIFRIAHSYGPGMNINNDGRIMSDLIQNVVNNSNIVLKSTGEAKRSFCYISDAIDAILKVVLCGSSNQIYNLSNETEEITIKNLANLLVTKYQTRGISLEFKIPTKPSNGYVSFKRKPLNTTKLENIGWKPKVSLEKGISNTVKYFDIENKKDE